MSTATERLTAWLNAAEELAQGQQDRNAFHQAWVKNADVPATLDLDDVAAVLVAATSTVVYAIVSPSGATEALFATREAAEAAMSRYDAECVWMPFELNR